MTSVKEFVDAIADASEISQCKFSIYCDKEPIKMKYRQWRVKVLAVYAEDRTTKKATSERAKKWFYYPELVDLGLDVVILKENSYRTIGRKKNAFEVCGTNEEKEYKGAVFYQYDVKPLSSQNLKLIDKMREKYNIQSVEVFEGEHHDIVLNDD